MLNPSPPINLPTPERFTTPHTYHNTPIAHIAIPHPCYPQRNSKPSTHPHLRCTAAAAGGGRVGLVALPVKALKAGQEAYWLDQIARNREEYFSGRGESPGRFVGSAATAAGLEEIASPEQVQAMFQGLDPATGELRCAPLQRADPRSKLAAGPLLEALTARAAEQGLEDLEALAGSRRSRGTYARCRRPARWAGPSG
jgi:hypothetical protein